MFFACMDGRSPTTISMVLTVQGRDSVPRFLEGRRFSRMASISQILAQLEMWRKDYRIDIEAIVCNDSDGLPPAWLESLQTSETLEWVDEDQLSELMAAWRSMVPGPPWLRATLMALLHSVPAPWYALDDSYARLHAWLASHAEDLDECNSRDERFAVVDESCEVPV